ncbi:hypothetical protein JX266_009353 [Neoarthrinium moseri]|nr:hypothetical protein JX266_009353 [Neoarthrinium moseri]
MQMIRTDEGISQVLNADQVGYELYNRLMRQSTDARLIQGDTMSSSLPKKKKIIEIIDSVIYRTEDGAEKMEELGYHIFEMGSELASDYDAILLQIEDKPWRRPRGLIPLMLRLYFQPTGRDVANIMTTPSDSELREAWIDATKAAGQRLDVLIDEAKALHTLFGKLRADLIDLHNHMRDGKTSLEKSRKSYTGVVYRWGFLHDPIPELNQGIAMVENLLPGLDNSRLYVDGIRNAMKATRQDLWRLNRTAITNWLHHSGLKL